MKIIAVIIAAFALVVPLSLVDSDAESEQGDSLPFADLDLISLLDGDDIDDGEAITGDISENLTITGEATITGDVKIAAGVIITFNEGSVLNINPSQSLSIAGAEGSGFFFEEGSAIAVAGKQVSVPADAKVLINGKIASAMEMGNISITNAKITAKCSLTIADKTVITVNDQPINFTGGFNITADINVEVKGGITSIFNVNSYSDIDAKVSVKLNADIGAISVQVQEHTLKLEASGNGTLDITTPKNNGTDFFKAKYSDSSKMTITVDDQKVTAEGSNSFNASISGLDKFNPADISTLLDLNIDLDGKVSQKIKADSITLADVLTLKGLDLSTEFAFSETKITEKTDLSVGEFVASMKEGTQSSTVSYKGLKVSDDSEIDFTEFVKNADYKAIVEKIAKILKDFNINPDEYSGAELIELANSGLAITDGEPIEMPQIDIDTIKKLIDNEDVKELIKLFSSIKLSENGKCSLDSITVDYKYPDVGASIDVSVKGVELNGKISADSKIEVSEKFKIESVVYKTVIGDTRVDFSFKNLDISAEYKDKLKVSVSLDDVFMKNIQDLSGQGASAKDVKVELTVDKDLSIEVKVKGEFSVKTYLNSNISSEYTIKKLDVDVVLSKFDFTQSDIQKLLESIEVKSFSADITAKTNGISLDMENVKLDIKALKISSSAVKVSGTLASKESRVNTVEGTVENYTATISPFSVTYDKSSITYNMKDGSKLVDERQVTEGKIIQTLTATGDVFYEDIQNVVMAFDYGEEVDLTVKGDGRVIMNDLDLNTTTVKGTVYAYDSLDSPAKDITINFTGAYLAITDGDISKMTIVAAKGYTLDPTTYEGFSVKDGYVVLEDDTISAESIGDKLKVTLDGKESVYEFGSLITVEMDKDVILVKDGDGNVYGYVEYGSWFYEFKDYKDLVLTTVKGKNVDVKSGETVKSDSDGFYFTVASESDVYTVSVPSGLIFRIGSDIVPIIEGETITVNSEKTTYDGKEAFDITASGNTFVQFPVKNDSYVLYHVVNGVPVEMVGEYTTIDGQTYLGAELTSYSVYFLSEGESGSEDSSGSSGMDMTLIIGIVVVLIVIIAVLFFVVKKRSTA